MSLCTLQMVQFAIRRPAGPNIKRPAGPNIKRRLEKDLSVSYHYVYRVGDVVGGQ